MVAEGMVRSASIDLCYAMLGNNTFMSVDVANALFITEVHMQLVDKTVAS